MCRRAAPDHDIYDALGENSRDGLGEFQRRQRRLFGRLEDDGITAGQGRSELPGRHHQWVVPRRDRTYASDLIAADHRGEAGHILAGDDAMHVTRGTGKEPETIDDAWHFILKHSDSRLAAIEGFERGERFGVLLDGVGKLEQKT